MSGLNNTAVLCVGMLLKPEINSSQGFRGDSVNTQVLKKDADGLCRLSQAALCLFEEVQ